MAFYKYAFVLFQYLLFLIKLCTPKFAIFVLGDSISYRMYRFGIVPSFNCTVEDPFIIRPVEKVDYKGFYGDYTSNKAWRCLSDTVSRVGFAFNWGISNVDGDYEIAYRNHRSPNDTINSVSNIISAIDEFQARSGKEEEEVFFLFSSNLWDVHRHQSVYHNQPDAYTWLQQYRKNYSSVVLKIFDKMRPIDKLILQTTHHIKFNDPLRELSILLNEEILKISVFFQLSLFDTRKFIEDNNMHLAENDNRHQKQEISILYAKQIGLMNWTNLNGDVSTQPKCYLPGTLLKVLGSGAYWLVQDDLKRHWLPNWDTLLFLGLQPSSAKVLSEKDFYGIDEGDPIQPCQSC